MGNYSIPNKNIERENHIDPEVKQYTLTPEQLAEVKRKYGEPRKKFENRHYSTNKIVSALEETGSVEEAAEILGIGTSHRLRVEMGNLGIPNPEKEEKTVEKPPVLSRMQQLEQALTREAYIAGKKAGLSDVKIMANAGFDYWAREITELKRKWKVLGMKFEPDQPQEPEKQEGPHELTAGGWEKINTPPEPPGEPCAPELSMAQDEEEVVWAESFRPVNAKLPIVTVHEKRVSFNITAFNLMEGAKILRVGVLKGKGMLIFRRALDNEPGTYTLSCTTKEGRVCSAKLGGGNLNKFLADCGVGVGKYQLSRNEARDRWEASILGDGTDGK